MKGVKIYLKLINQRSITRTDYHTQIVQLRAGARERIRESRMALQQGSKGAQKRSEKTMVSECRHKNKCIFLLERLHGIRLSKISGLIPVVSSFKG